MNYRALAMALDSCNIGRMDPTPPEAPPIALSEPVPEVDGIVAPGAGCSLRVGDTVTSFRSQAALFGSWGEVTELDVEVGYGGRPIFVMRIAPVGDRAPYSTTTTELYTTHQAAVYISELDARN